MAMEYLHCLMEPGMKEGGRMARSMAREHSHCLMEPGMRESGNMERHMKSKQTNYHGIYWGHTMRVGISLIQGDRE